MEIHWRNVGELTEAEQEGAEARLEALATGHTDLIDIRISGRASGHHRLGDREIRISCQARGKEIVARRTRTALGLALNDALDSFEREVHRLRRRRRDRSRELPTPAPHLGIVDRILAEQGYGFILTDGGEQVYFHRNAVKHGLDFARLEEGDRVALEIEDGREGSQASAVFAPPPDAPTP